LENIPKTLRDAIHIAKALGFKYLWLDSLCIIQGDELDWAEQGAAMTDIYGRSKLNISASSSKNSDEGILTKLQDHGIRIGISCHYDASNECETVFVGYDIKTLDLEEKHISTRE
jgi:Heterokaryon incompatibility protein (HET)